MKNTSYIVVDGEKVEMTNKLLSTAIALFQDNIEGNNKRKALSEQWLDNQDVMEALRISPRTLQNMRDNGTLKYSKVGGKIYYKSADVEHLLEVGYNG